MPRHVRLVIVCEDLLHETFMRALLFEHGFTRHQLTFKKGVSGQGDAKTRVCELVCRELQAIRRFAGKGLIYVVDADNMTVAERRSWVENACRASDIDPPRQDEAVFAVIPKWEIENWLAYLRGEPVDEDSNRYDKYRRCESDIYPLVKRLAKMCEKQDLPNAPRSLTVACLDYPRFRKWIKGK